MLLTIGLNLATIALLAVFAWRLYRRHGSWLQLGILFSLTLIINYPLRIMELSAFPNDSRPSYPGLVNPDVLRGLSLLQIPGIAAFCIGYWLWDRRVKKHAILYPKLLPTNDAWHFGIIMALYPVSLAAKVIKIATGNYVSFLIGKDQNLMWANIIENLHMVGWTCLAGIWLLFLLGRVRNPFQWALFLGITVLELSYQLIQGSKTFLLLPLYIWLLVYYYAKGRIPWKAAAAVVVFAALVVFPFVSAYRDYFGSEYRGTIPSLQNFDAQKALQDTYKVSQGEDKTFVQSLLTMLGRFSGADELYNMRHMVPMAMPFKHGQDFEAILFVVIPRVVWPSKPIFSPGAAYGTALGTVTSVTPFPLGEMYWNFGGAGMALGMSLWGALMAACMSLLDRFFKKEGHRFLVAAIFLAEAYWLTTGEGMLAMQVTTVIKKTVVYVILYQCARIALMTLGVRSKATQTGSLQERLPA